MERPRAVEVSAANEALPEGNTLTRGLRPTLMAGAVSLLAVAYLGGIAGILPFCLLAFGVLLPLSALTSSALRGTGLSDELRVCAGASIGMLLLIPMYYVRKLLRIPGPVFDVVAMLGLLGASWYSGNLRRFTRTLMSPSFRVALWLFFGVIPVAACLVWMGFEVPRGDSVHYYGLFTVDFSNLSGMVAMIRASAGAPQFVTAGSGPLHYHWWFFVIPTWMSEFCGLRFRGSSALALGNFLAALVLSATVFATAVDQLRRRVDVSERIRFKLALLTTSIVIFAPFSSYAYQFLVARLGRSWFTVGTRNSLMLSIVNSMSTFGNNTLALALILVLVAALIALGERWSWKLGALIGLAGLGLFGLSITLTFPLALSCGAWVVLGKVRSPWRMLVIAAVTGVIGLPLLRLTNLMGDSSQHLVVSFDRAQFVQNVVLGMAPVVLLALVSLRVSRRVSLSWLLFASGLLIPTLIDFGGHGAVSSTMSMKMASMLAVVATPLLADAVFYLGLNPQSVRLPWLRALAAVVVLVGLVNSAAYTFQFAARRELSRGEDRSASLPLQYIQALDYVRRNTKVTAVVVDPGGDLLPDTIGTLLVAERQVWLPTRYSAELFRTDLDNPEIMARLKIWRDWEKGNFFDETLAATIADHADILVARPEIRSASWEPKYVAGPYAIYASRRR